MAQGWSGGRLLVTNKDAPLSDMVLCCVETVRGLSFQANTITSWAARSIVTYHQVRSQSSCGHYFKQLTFLLVSNKHPKVIQCKIVQVRKKGTKILANQNFVETKLF